MLRCAVGRAVVSNSHLHAGVRCGQRVRLMVRWLNESDAQPARGGARRPSRAVHVHLGRSGQLVVHHVLDPLDVESPGRYVRGEQHTRVLATLSEALESLEARALLHAALQHERRHLQKREQRLEALKRRDGVGEQDGAPMGEASAQQEQQKGILLIGRTRELGLHERGSRPPQSAVLGGRRSNQSQSVAISRNQNNGMVMRGRSILGMAMRGRSTPTRTSDAIRGHQMQSEAIRCNQMQSEAISAPARGLWPRVPCERGRPP